MQYVYCVKEQVLPPTDVKTFSSASTEQNKTRNHDNTLYPYQSGEDRVAIGMEEATLIYNNTVVIIRFNILLQILSFVNMSGSVLHH